MDAIKFMQEYQRMCNSCERCADCPLYTDMQCAEMPSRYTNDFSSKLIKAVEDWSAVHPQTTRAALFKKTHPFAVSDSTGSLLICPVVVDKNVICPLNGECTQCRKNYWLKEV